MPKNKSIKKVMVIGSGPIVIGQAAEFDYAGTQACRTLKSEKIEVVLVNSNPATIMTDKAMADAIYIEPLTITTLQRIIQLEKPDSLLPSLGGQTGLTLAMQLAESGFLDKHGVRLLGVNCDTINKAEDRQLFKETMQEINQPCIPSKVVNTTKDALEFAETIGYPVIVRPAFTMGGAGGGIAESAQKLAEIAANGLAMSPITQILVEKSIYGWKEIEFEVMRDSAGNTITICGMENMDPVGIHTGDSIVVAPTMTLSDKEYQMLRGAALNIIAALKIEGGCNCQFALEPNSMDYAVIEVNPRVSRSSALASKATGYPIAKVATLVALGYTLDEIPNAVTGKTWACFEPAVDYCVVKLPKWPFDKFVYAKRALGTQMKATGEVMAIAPSFEMALMKAVRGAENLYTLSSPAVQGWTDEQVEQRLMPASDYRLFVLYEAIKRGFSIEHIAKKTMIDPWFLDRIKTLVDFEKSIDNRAILPDEYLRGKRLGYTDGAMSKISKNKLPCHRKAVYKMVDTCAGEFAAHTPYFYSTYDTENEAAQFRENNKTGKRRVIVFGSGPIRIGQGIEFDYASVHCVWALKSLGCEVIIVNNNPETVSTDFDTADRLYFEPLTPEDVDNVIATEEPYGVVVAFGGQTAIKLTKHLAETGVRILGTSADSIDAAEDRERFDALLENLNIKRPKGLTVHTAEQAIKAGEQLGYPVLLRPSYVLGGQNMIIAFSTDDVIEYMDVILRLNPGNTVLVDKYLMGTEIEVDAICDGEKILIPGIMEHIERAGVHSGDSIAVYPTPNINDAVAEKIVNYTEKLALGLDTKGLINIQYIVSGGEIYVIEVNPRSSRTVPYISKVTGVPMIHLATACMMGKKLDKLGYGTGLFRPTPYFAVKVPIFSFEKLTDLDTQLGPEMKSTGEVLGIGRTLDEALYKGLTAAGYKLKMQSGGVLMSVRDSDKPEIGNLAKMYSELGYKIYATAGTADTIEKSGIQVERVAKISENAEESTFSLLESGKVDLMISTSTKGRIPTQDDVKLRRKAVTLAIPHLTSLDTASAMAFCLKSRYSQKNTELVNINKMRTEKQRLKFTKMHGSGNDYIFIDCLSKPIINMESIAVSLSDRERGVGADGAVFILPSSKADAKMRVFSADGTEASMCSSAIRCVAKYLFDNKKTAKKNITIETKSGIKNVQVFVSGGRVSLVSVEMDTPAAEDKAAATELEFKHEGRSIKGYALNLDGARLVVFSDDVNAENIDQIGQIIDAHPMFAGGGVSVQFVQVIDPAHLKVRTWQRGIDENHNSGTAAAAAAFAACRTGLAKHGTDIAVRMSRGEFNICISKSQSADQSADHSTDKNQNGESKDTIILTGDAVEVYKGVVWL